MAVAGFAVPVPDPYRYSFQMSASAPLLPVSPSDALSIGGAQAGLIATTVAATTARHEDGIYAPYRTLAAELSLHQALYATYATYRDMRMRSIDDAYRETFHPESASSLAVAPFLPRNLKHPYVFVPILLLGTLGGLSAVGTIAAQPSDFDGAHFVRDESIGLVLAWNAGVTEEAFERGVLYEELEHAMPRWPARIIDMSIFSALHVPGEIQAHQGADTILLGLASRAVVGLLCDVAYDDGGLQESIALHVGWDAIALTLAAVTGKPGISGGSGLVRPTDARGSVASTTPFIVPLLSGTF